jgi:putative MATE family efflux protein
MNIVAASTMNSAETSTDAEAGRKAMEDCRHAAKLRAREAMLHGPIFKTMMGLALPTIGVLVAQTFVNVAETFYVSRLGTEALVGVALVFPIWMLMTMMSAGGIGGGVASAVARAVGAGRHEDANALVLHTLVIAVAFGLLFSVLAIGFGSHLYQALGGKDEALHSALVYSNFIFLSAVPIWIVNLLSAALRGIGNVRVPALVTLIGAAVLVPLSPAFIFGIGPFHGFGVAGAGIAVTLYYCAATVAMLLYMASGRSALRLSFDRLRWPLFRDILKVGLLAALNTVQLNLMVMLVTAAVGQFGVGAIGGYGTASRLDYVLIPIMFGLGTAILTMVGTNIGAGDIARAKKIAWFGTAINMAFTEAVGLLVAFFPWLWIGLFSHDSTILGTGALYFRIVAPVYAPRGSSVERSRGTNADSRPLRRRLRRTEAPGPSPRRPVRALVMVRRRRSERAILRCAQARSRPTRTRAGSCCRCHARHCRAD